jgi:ABC-type nitrate/sulfonate/bicarbonate transport system substrate-binding protein
MNLPAMPAALYVGAVAAYATGEPFGAVAEAGTINRPIPYEKDVDESFSQNVQPVQITLEKKEHSFGRFGYDAAHFPMHGIDVVGRRFARVRRRTASRLSWHCQPVTSSCD